MDLSGNPILLFGWEPCKFGIPNLLQFPDIGQNFQIPGQSLIIKNFDNSKTSNDIDTKLGPITKLDKRNTTTFKKFDGDFMLSSYDVIVIFLIYG